MKSHIGNFVLSVLGAIIVFCFSDVTNYSRLAQVTGENKTSNKIIMQIHSNLNVTVNEKSLIVPNGIGINSTLWNDHSLDKLGTERKTTIFGMITPAMSPLHTHDSSGTIHVESTEYRNYARG